VREPKPYLRKANQTYYVQLGKKQIPLGTDKAKAWEEYHKVMAGHRQLPPSVPAARVVNEYLAWASRNREPSTYKWYKGHLESFVRYIGLTLRASDLKPLHVTRWIDSEYSGQSDNTKNAAIRTVKRAFNWARKQGIIPASPVADVEMPTPTPRETYITQEQFDALLPLVKDRAFREFLTILWETGCRPQEARIVEASNFIEARGVWSFERKKSKGRRRRRIVYLSPKALSITKRLAAKYPTGPILRNKLGRPWTKNALMHRFYRLRQEVDFPVHAYAFRHGFATAALKRGVDPLRVALLLGHKDTRMLEWVYQHVDENDDHLRAGLTIGTGD
jgi:integrase